MNASFSQTRSIFSIVGIVTLFILSFSISSASAYASGTRVGPGIIFSKDDVTSGYQFVSSNPGSRMIFVETTWNVPSVACTTNSQILYFFVTISHVTDFDSGSELTVGCVAGIGGSSPSYTMAYWLGYNTNSINERVNAGDVVKTITSEDLTSGAVSVTIEDMTESWATVQNGNVGTSTSTGIVNLYMYGNLATSSNPLADFSMVKFGSIKITLKGHTGSAGSFLSTKGVVVKEYILINPSDKHVLVKPSTITASSTSVNLKWIQGI
jgi:hypothetical protein